MIGMAMRLCRRWASGLTMQVRELSGSSRKPRRQQVSCGVERTMTVCSLAISVMFSGRRGRPSRRVPG
jgi:hypothetical protein